MSASRKRTRFTKQYFHIGIAFITLLLLLVFAAGRSRMGGWVDYRASQPWDQEDIRLDEQNPAVGQTFCPSRRSLTGMTIFLDEYESRKHQLQFNVTLRKSNAEGVIIFQQSKSLTPPADGSVFISPPNLSAAAGDCLYIEIEKQAGSRNFYLSASSFDAYPQGQLRIGQQLLEKDLKFILHTNPPLSFTAGLKYLTRMAQMLLITALQLLSGLAVLRLLWPDLSSRPVHTFLFAITLGNAIAIIVLAGLDLLHFPISQSALPLTILVGCASLFLIINWLKQTKEQHQSIPAAIRTRFGLLASAMRRESGFVFLFALLVFYKSIQIQQLTVPPWVDGLRHFHLVNQLLRSHMTATYFYPVGFHLNTIFLGGLLNLPLPGIMLTYGQLLSVYASLGFYLFVLDLFHDKSAALAASLVYSVFLALPSDYAMWARYPFLLGLALLFPVYAAITCALNAQFQRWTWLTAILLVCVGFAHYAALVILLALLGASWITRTNQRTSLNWRPIAWVSLPLIAILALKFISTGFSGRLQAIVAQNQQNAMNIDLFDRLMGLVDNNWLMLLLVITAMLVAWPRFKHRTEFLLAWVLLLVLFNSLQLLLLDASVVSPADGTVLGAFFFSIVAGLHFSSSWQAILRFIPAWSARLAGILVLLVLLIAGANIQAGVVDSQSVFFNEADVEAVEWINRSIPAPANFLLPSYVFGDSLQPANGGGWLPAFTPHQVILMPVTDQPGMVSQVLQNEAIGYLYLGKGMQPSPEIEKYMLENVEDFQEIYSNDSVRILKFAPK